MRTIYLDCFAGISGDMLLGAMLDLGLDITDLKAELSKLDLHGFAVDSQKTNRCGITSTKFDVIVHHHDHHHDHHEHDHHVAEHPAHAHRPLSEIVRLIEASELADRVKGRAIAVFRRLGEAEAKIHGVPVETVQFHEVGAVDSIVDIVGACIGLDLLGIEKIVCSALHVGTGTFECAHGVYPVPGPATAELLRNAPVYAGEVRGELVTPTGAAIVSTLASEFGPLPAMNVLRVGYGAGARKYPHFPNVLRAFLGETELEAAPNTVAVIEANLDDLSPQVLGHLMERAFASGALDLFYTPVQMKKNRPGVLLTALCAPYDRDAIINLIFSETSTLGVRHRIEQRTTLNREHIAVKTEYGSIRIKAASDASGKRRNFAPEFDDCREAAESHGVPLREVQQAAIVAFLQLER
ncbi:MAG: nickel pincer cofactor biosynthesis protein LarC [Acidobacteria bacterium]|nr:nickel pincer cofactor biosynthesis protein LarC [Acidobacteriota bacterium]